MGDIGMTVKQLIKKLKKHNINEQVRFYFLENYILGGCKLETIISADNQVEITIEREIK